MENIKKYIPRTIKIFIKNESNKLGITKKQYRKICNVNSLFLNKRRFARKHTFIDYGVYLMYMEMNKSYLPLQKLSKKVSKFYRYMYENEDEFHVLLSLEDFKKKILEITK